MPRFQGIPVEEETTPRFGGELIAPAEPMQAPEPKPVSPFAGFENAYKSTMDLLDTYLPNQEEIKRQAGLMVRNIIEGAGGTMEFLGTPLKVAIEQATGKPVDVAGMITEPLGLPQPETPTERVISTAEQMMTGAGGLTGLAKQSARLMEMGVPQKMLEALAAKPAQQAVAAGTMGAAGQIAAETGATPREQLAVSLATGIAAPGAPSAFNIGKKATQQFIKSSQLGYKIPPALAKPSTAQQFIEGGLAGSAATRQKAAAYNQEVTNKLIKKDINYPDDMPLSHEGLETIRANAGKAYEKAKTIGMFNADKSYFDDLKRIAKTKSAMAQEFPEMVKKDIVKMVGIYNKNQMSADAVIEAVKQLRADASAGFASADPAISAMAKAKGQMATALEKLMERQAQQTAPDLVPELRAARQLIAKTYTIGKALKGENIDARVLGRELDKNKPMSGLTREVGEFGRNFKGAAMTDVVQPTNFRVTDLLLSSGISGVTGNPAYMALMAARPGLRSLILSKPYQKMLAQARPNEMKRIMQMPKEVRAAEMIGLLHELQDSSENESR